MNPGLSTLQIRVRALNFWVVFLCITIVVLCLSGIVVVFGCPCPNFPVAYVAYELTEFC
jgi:hypothetical protein